MNQVMLYLESVLNGMGRFWEANKLIVVLFAFLLVWWLSEKKPKEEKSGLLFGYTLCMTLLLVFPVTAVFIMIYQTGYYDYEWAWSMVPVTAMIAYGATLLIEKSVKKSRVLLGILGVAAVLCLCGNQGTLTTVTEKEATSEEDTAEVLQAIYDMGVVEKRKLWATRNMMEQVRRQDGKILLIYGRDMWDVKSGAYDYEAYSEELTNAYIWLEVMNMQAEVVSVMADPQTAFAAICESEDLNRCREAHLRTVLDAGANVLVLPHTVAVHIEESIFQLAEERQLAVQNTYTEEYTIYLLE